MRLLGFGLSELVSEQTSLEARLAGIEPPFAQYKATRQALLRYMELAKEDDGEKLPPPPGILFTGGPYEGISRLASRLRLIGDLPEDAVIPANSKIYEGPLVDAVKRFQERHGLTPNGYLTVDTVGQLNVTLGHVAASSAPAEQLYCPALGDESPGFHHSGVSRRWRLGTGDLQ